MGLAHLSHTNNNGGLLPLSLCGIPFHTFAFKALSPPLEVHRAHFLLSSADVRRDSLRAWHLCSDLLARPASTVRRRDRPPRGCAAHPHRIHWCPRTSSNVGMRKKITPRTHRRDRLADVLSSPLLTAPVIITRDASSSTISRLIVQVVISPRPRTRQFAPLARTSIR